MDTKYGIAASASLDRLPRDIVFNICDYLGMDEMISLFKVNSNLAKFGGKERTSFLIHYDWTRRVCNAMLWACEHGDVTFASSLMSYGYDLDQVDSTWLRARRRIELRPPYRHELSGYRLRQAIDLSLLNKAVDCDQPDFVRFLFENGKESGNKPLEVKRFPPGYSDFNQGHLSLLHLARSAHMLRLLLAIEPGLPIDDGPVTKYEPLLLWLIERGIGVESLSVLLHEGARPDGAVLSSDCIRVHFEGNCSFSEKSRSLSPQTPIEAAVYHSNLPAFQLLFNWGAEFEYAEFDHVEMDRINLQSYLAMCFFSTKSDLHSSCDIAENILKICVSHGLDLQAPYKRRRGVDFDSEPGQDTLPGHALMHCDSVTMLEALISVGISFDVPITQLFDLQSQHKFHGRELNIRESHDPAFLLLRVFFRRLKADPTSGDPKFADSSFFQCLRRKLQMLPQREEGAKEQSNLEYVVQSAPACRLEATVLAVLGAYGSARLDKGCIRLLLRRTYSWGGTLHTSRRLVETLICAGAPIYSRPDQSSVLRRAFQIPVTPRSFPQTLDLATGIRPVLDREKETGVPAPTADEIWQRQDNAAAIMNLLIGHGAELKDKEISAARKSGWVPPPESFQLQRLYAVTGPMSSK
ncbi:hypothetical protein CkaCkLH20_09085 [Colletotrichum karsti]|uniref:F-box domain-containing protein n=1 Tax=Colletotrichum karsti TaxID=1095194 RepID=A0A9P6LI63_9PEZI|nr:uncharacterized protein CkaCkLH20_09085 [Colletotrichum karsti]KAF9873272.1 hypothetical protein CkaCkLH20_09085 [Colletotrichum karsti]